MKQVIILVLILLGFNSCLKPEHEALKFNSSQPLTLNDGIPTSTLSSEHIDSNGLASIYTSSTSDATNFQQRSLLVFRHGNLVAEHYYKSYKDATQPLPVWSCTKQIVSLLVGIALDKGLIGSLDDKVSQYLPELNADKKDITIRHCLTMSSGIAYKTFGIDSDNSQVLQEKPDNLLDFINTMPMEHTPGSFFLYKDVDPQLLVLVLEKVTQKPLTIWADEVLFSKIETQHLEWLHYKDGTTLGGWGVLTTPRELGRIANLVLAKGYYKGTSIVSEAYLNQLKQFQIQPDNADRGYGLLWWNYPNTDIYFMFGNGGQLAFVKPSKDLVVVITGENQLQGDLRLPLERAKGYFDAIVGYCY